MTQLLKLGLDTGGKAQILFWFTMVRLIGLATKTAWDDMLLSKVPRFSSASGGSSPHVPAASPVFPP